MERMNFIAPKPPMAHPGASVASGMSTLAKAVMGVAGLFFAAFLCVAFFGSSSGRAMPPTRRESNLTREQQGEAEQITQAFHSLFEGDLQGHEEAFGRLYAKFTGSCPLTPQDIADANALIVTLSSPCIGTNEQRAAERADQDAAYEVALATDLQRKHEKDRQIEMTKALDALLGVLSKATEAFNACSKDLQLLERCWQHVCQTTSGGAPSEGFAVFFQETEKRLISADYSRPSIPEEIEEGLVDRFNTQFPEEGKFFDEKRAALAEGYNAYAYAIKNMQDKLAWERLKVYHREVGETFFRDQLFRDQLFRELLAKVKGREELPRPPGC